MSIRIPLVIVLIGFSSGCNMFPNWMHPTNLWKLNAQDPPSNDAMYFSVPDPVTSDPFLNSSAEQSSQPDEFSTFGELDPAAK